MTHSRVITVGKNQLISAALLTFLMHGHTVTAQQSTAASGDAKAAGQAETRSVSASQEASVNAALKDSLDSKHARVGQQVAAVTRQKAKVGDAVVPKGTTLLGHVTSVSEHSRDNANGSVSMLFDQARLKDGTMLPIHAAIRGLAPSATAAAQANDDMSTPMGGASAGAGAGMSGGRSGGERSGLVGGTVSGATNMVGSATNTAVGPVDSSANVAGRTVANTNYGVMAGLSTVPGINLTTSSDTSTSGTISAPGRNVHLDSGTQMTLAVSAR
jgi:hypothetical protein